VEVTPLKVQVIALPVNEVPATLTVVVPLATAAELGVRLLIVGAVLKLDAAQTLCRLAASMEPRPTTGE
jgi:hypothetical protein